MYTTKRKSLFVGCLEQFVYSKKEKGRDFRKKYGCVDVYTKLSGFEIYYSKRGTHGLIYKSGHLNKSRVHDSMIKGPQRNGFHYTCKKSKI